MDRVTIPLWLTAAQRWDACRIDLPKLMATHRLDDVVHDGRCIRLTGRYFRVERALRALNEALGTDAYLPLVAPG